MTRWWPSNWKPQGSVSGGAQGLLLVAQVGEGDAQTVVGVDPVPPPGAPLGVPLGAAEAVASAMAAQAPRRPSSRRPWHRWRRTPSA
ncbi:hypothetical protein [Streptomyces cyaneochromogenes]|uniref:hypothetical protein n=1 Tax=Streptomyces cyaneochromogenes TaxID=2496836 RepID=UPI001E5E1298|nr:hypothetical protein [Streptomyces cyaneochromogenes]